MLNQALLALLFGIGVFIAFLFIARQLGNDKASAKHQQRVLGRIYEEQEQYARQSALENINILKGDASGAGKFLMNVPFIGQKTYDLILKAGMEHNVALFLLFTAALFVGLLLLFTQFLMFPLALLAALALTLLLPRFYLKRRIKKRNEAFINMFPDAVDMIVRSVKSGHPLNTALKMIAENMDPPVRTEFKQLVDEIAFGRSTTEALIRMSNRIDEPDLQFFVVILSVQQETGGNLAEVLGNLSTIIRKRKQLRLKIKAMTSEGRATAYILGSLPFCIFGAIHVTTPEYLTPLFITHPGRMILGGSLFLIGLAAFIVYNMLQIDI